MHGIKKPDPDNLNNIKSNILKFGATSIWGAVVAILWLVSIVYDFITSSSDFSLVSSLIEYTIAFTIIFMIGHLVIIFLREMRNTFRTDYNVDFFKNERIKNGRPSEETKEESERIEALMEAVANSWTVKVESDDEEELYIPANAKELRNSEIICKEIIETAPTNPETVEILNGWLIAENEMRKRKFTGSYKLIGLAIAIGLFLIFVIGSSPKNEIGIAILFFWIPAIIYYFSARTPYYLIEKRSNSQLASGLLGGAFAVLGSGSIIKTKWSDGSTSTDTSGYWMSWVIGIFLLLFFSLLIFPMACINYVRNYVINW